MVYAMENNWLELFRKEYKPLLKDRYDEFEYGLSCPKARHIRVNKCRNIDYMQELESISSLESLSQYENMYKVVEEKENIVESITFQTGGAYIMNPSSLAPAKILMSYMGQNPVMLDVSSAPGGKTCAISDMTNRKGVIVANEISSSRLKSLHFNLEKYGAYNVKTISLDGRLLPKYFENSFDGILLDAPCSNENKIFRNKTVQAQWGKELVCRMAELQFQLIKSAFSCLKSGGVLVYSTCTLSLEENEMVVKKLLDEFSDAYLLPCGKEYGKGLSGIDEIDENVARIMPDKDNIDGFFAAAIAKKGHLVPYDFIHTKLSKKEEEFFKKYFPEYSHDHISIKEVDRKGYIETAPEIFKNIRFKRRGLNLYKDTGKIYEPTCQSVWELGNYTKENMKYNISYEFSKNYMKGFDISCNDNYNNELLYYNNIPVGYGKKIENTIKNKLDRYFLYGKNIEW